MAAQELDRTAASILTEEELAAINDDEYDKSALQAIVGDGDDDEEPSPPEPAAATERETAPKAVPVVEPKNSEPSISLTGEEPRPPSRYQVQLPEDFAEREKAVRDESEDLAQKFREGDIDFDEYFEASQRLARERESLASLRTKAEIAQEMSAQSAEQEWNWTVRSFINRVKASDGVDYLKDQAMLQDFDAFVKVLANNPANADKSAEWFLSEAHRRAQILHGAPTKQTDPDPTPEKTGRRQAADLSKIPKNLASVPGGEGPGDVGDEFADVDSLEGVALEQAIARMTPAQREKYASA